MTKEKYSLYSLEKLNESIDKESHSISSLFWFAIGFLTAILLTVIILIPNV